MKKIFTLLFATAMLSSAFAQYGQNDQRGYDNDRDVVMNQGNHRIDKHDDIYKGGSYIFTAREKNMQIAQINREYDYKIRTVRNHFYMGRYQKMRQIRILEQKRDMEIQAVMAKFLDRRNKFGDRGRRNGNKW